MLDYLRHFTHLSLKNHNNAKKYNLWEDLGNAKTEVLRMTSRDSVQRVSRTRVQILVKYVECRRYYFEGIYTLILRIPKSI